MGNWNDAVKGSSEKWREAMKRALDAKLPASRYVVESRIAWQQAQDDMAAFFIHVCEGLV